MSYRTPWTSTHMSGVMLGMYRMQILWVVRASSVSAGLPFSRLPVWGITAHHTAATVCSSTGYCPSSSLVWLRPIRLMVPRCRRSEARLILQVTASASFSCLPL